MQIRTSFARAILIVMAAVTLFAQSTTQSIIGLVTDSTGAVIQGAKVTLTNIGTNVVLTTTTNETGNYAFPLLQVGDYNVRVEAQGFKSEVVRGVRVETALQSRQDVKLDIGSVVESVEVSANAVLLNTENASTGAVIDNRRIVELPLMAGTCRTSPSWFRASSSASGPAAPMAPAAASLYPVRASA